MEADNVYLGLRGTAHTLMQTHGMASPTVAAERAGSASRTSTSAVTPTGSTWRPSSAAYLGRTPDVIAPLRSSKMTIAKFMRSLVMAPVEAPLPFRTLLWSAESSVHREVLQSPQPANKQYADSVRDRVSPQTTPGRERTVVRIRTQSRSRSGPEPAAKCLFAQGMQESQERRARQTRQRVPACPKYLLLATLRRCQ